MCLKHLQKHLKNTWNHCKHTQHRDKTLASSYVWKHMQYPNKHTCNIRRKKQMKHWKHELATYVYNHYNMCNIPIYFYNIRMKHLQRTSKTFVWNICNIPIYFGRAGNDRAVATRRQPRAASGRAGSRAQERSRTSRAGAEQDVRELILLFYYVSGTCCSEWSETSGLLDVLMIVFPKKKRIATNSSVRKVFFRVKINIRYYQTWALKRTNIYRNIYMIVRFKLFYLIWTQVMSLVYIWDAPFIQENMQL
jgi:hypothetical protein